jgi:gliding motility-associated-like protein
MSSFHKKNIKLKISNVIVLGLFISNIAFGQKILFEEYCNCAVTVDGIPIRLGTDLQNFYTPKPSFIPNSVVLKKVFLSFTTFQVQQSFNDYENWQNVFITFNNHQIYIHQANKVSPLIKHFSYAISDPNFTTVGHYFFIDVTNYYNTNSDFQLLIPSQLNEEPPTTYPDTDEYFLTVIYEDPSLPLTNIVLVNKNKDVEPIEVYNLSNKINPIDPTKKMALALNSSNICNKGVPDSSTVFVNSQYMGSLSVDEGVECGGVSGNMFFTADTLIAYDNDIANNTFSGSDGVADIQPYLTNSTDLEIKFKYWSVGLNQGIAGWYTNPIHQLVLAYTTSCEEFTTTTPQPQAVCQNSPLQLNVTGGNRYEWLPKRGLSCYDCPNPIVSTDSSRFYTVRVWNNDTCSVTRPVNITVYKLPKFKAAEITPTECANSTGKIVISKHASTTGAVLWSLNGGAFEQGGATVKNYENLPEGSYSIILKDDNDCVHDTILEVGYSISTKADFSLNPNKGLAPITINVSNQSTNYTNSAWYLQNSYTDSSLTQFTLDKSGAYTLKLITWYKDLKCADTAERTILVYDTLIVSVPNVFSPNNDGVNDFFGLQSNQPAAISYQLFNRWGNVVKSNLTQTEGAVFEPLWDGDGFDQGVYYYQMTIEAKDLPKQEVKGFFHLER